MLKTILPGSAKLTLINEAPRSYYSGMLPGTVAKLYTNEDLQISLAPLAAWCKADYIEKRVKKIQAAENKVHLDDGSVVEYDILVINVGSKTAGSFNVPGVWDHSLTTRPINDLLPKIEKKEKEFLESGVIPDIAVCGAGAAGVELAFGFKRRWTDLFKQDIKVKILSASEEIMPTVHPSLRKQIQRRLIEQGIETIPNARVKSVQKDGVTLVDGRVIACN